MLGVNSLVEFSERSVRLEYDSSNLASWKESHVEGKVYLEKGRCSAIETDFSKIGEIY